MEGVPFSYFFHDATFLSPIFTFFVLTPTYILLQCSLEMFLPLHILLTLLEKFSTALVADGLVFGLSLCMTDT